MSYWKWEQKYNTGIDVIDVQHQRIVKYINTLHGCLGNDEKDKIADVLHDMVDYTLTHFAFEEELMIQSGYPLEMGHKQAHDDFSAKIKEYQDRFDAGEDIARELMDELKHWLASHIVYEDSEYIPMVKSTFDPGWVRGAIKRFFS